MIAFKMEVSIFILGLSMQKFVEVLGKPVHVNLTGRGVKALNQLSEPVSIEMELLFSCMLRKRLLFNPGIKENASQIHENLYLFFHAVMTEHCNLSDYESLSDIPVTDFPTDKLRQMVPRWVRIDYKSGKWKGSFGYV
ncbi:MAG: hypothetical protein OEZ34_01820 [Spirochaetia bacterium]|nr:hypothetical protein [Spirochaetia bacterium]